VAKKKIMGDILSDINSADILKVAKGAGDEIMDVYSSDFTIEQKEDRSPLTLADKRSHEVISRDLSILYPDIPILSEEGTDIPYSKREWWKYFWLVDPLDGTKEFINRNGEFTVNIALIQNSKPVLGVIYIPVRKIFYYAKKGSGAYRLAGNKLPETLNNGRKIIEISARLPLSDSQSRPFTVVGSRSHMSKETEEYINRLKEVHGEVHIIPTGSSLKLCMVAEGRADVYPRFGPTMEWDIAAGQVIVEEAGGKVINAETGEPLRYNKENLLNPWFIVEKNL
jgi:3'(2'), 5'-bisphosphate nucleotidase